MMFLSKVPAIRIKQHTSSQRPRLAVLIDADNIQDALIDRILQEIEKYGTPCMTRLYGTNTHLRGWKAKATTLGIEVRKVVPGTNASDLTLTVDAMDLLYTKAFDGFCIISSDRHFEPLATRLRQSNLIVYGFGKSTTKAVLRNACDKFFCIASLCDKSITRTVIKKRKRSNRVKRRCGNLPGKRTSKKTSKQERGSSVKKRHAMGGNPSAGVPSHGKRLDAVASSPWLSRMIRFLRRLAGVHKTRGQRPSNCRVPVNGPTTFPYP